MVAHSNELAAFGNTVGVQTGPMRSRLDTRSESYRQNRAAMEQLVGELDAELSAVPAVGGERYIERHRTRGKMLVRERIEALVDPDTPFLELMPLAAWGTGDPVGAGTVAGIGVVSGIECVITGTDMTVRGGAANPSTVRKGERAQEIARENRLPLVNLTESAGADLPRQAEIFVPGGAGFKNLTQLSKAGIPTVSLVFGPSTAGGAYTPGMSDYIVMVDQQAKVYLGGPPLVKMAIDEVVDEETLGGAEMHARVSGLSDYLAADDMDALRIGRDIIAHLNWRKLGPGPTLPADDPVYEPDELLGVPSADIRVPFDVREIIARVVDGSRFEDFKPLYGTQLVCGWASIGGFPVGILGNNGILFSEESQKGAQFIQLCNATDTPLVFLQNITGFMVGSKAERGGIIKDGAKLINAVSNSEVPHLTADGRGVVRSRQLRDVRPGVRSALRVHVAQPPHRRDGPQAARRGDGDRRPQRRRTAWGRGRRGTTARPDGSPGGEGRGGVDGTVRHGPHLGRRHHRSRATRAPVLGLALSATHSNNVQRRARLRDLAALMSAGRIQRLLVANRGEIAVRVARTAQPPRHGDGWRVLGGRCRGELRRRLRHGGGHRRHDTGRVVPPRIGA